MNFRFRDIRENLDLKQREIAERISISRDNYAGFESEIINIPLTRFNQYCNEFCLSMDYVAKLTNKTNHSKNMPVVLNKKIIAERLIEMQNSRKKKNKEMAEIIGVDASSYSRYRNPNDYRIIQTLMLKKLSVEFGYSMDYLCGRSDQKYIKK